MAQAPLDDNPTNPIEGGRGRDQRAPQCAL